VYDLCNTYNVLFIADEIRMGICRTGKLLSSDYLGPSRKPNMITLGKSITGGVYPASYILGDESVMSVVGTREIMFTYAFSPLAIVATRAALQVAETERLSDRARELERLFLRQAKEKKWEDYPFVNYVTARGAEFGIWLVKGNELLCRKIGFSCMDKGLLLFPKELHLKMSSTIAIGDDEFEKALKVLAEAIEECSQEYYTPSKRHRAHL
jgi:ornithine--oxo-acid transaminase